MLTGQRDQRCIRYAVPQEVGQAGDQVVVVRLVQIQESWITQDRDNRTSQCFYFTAASGTFLCPDPFHVNCVRFG